MNVNKQKAEILRSDFSKYQLSRLDVDGEIVSIKVFLSAEDGKDEILLTFRRVMILNLKKFPFSEADCTTIENGSLTVEAGSQARIALADHGYEHRPNEPISSVYIFKIEGEIELSIIAEELFSEGHC